MNRFEEIALQFILQTSESLFLFELNVGLWFPAWLLRGCERIAPFIVLQRCS